METKNYDYTINMGERACNRCEGTTRAGARCRNQTCKYGPYCWQHSVANPQGQTEYRGNAIRNGLRVGPSTIPGAGLGLFATRTYERCTRQGGCPIAEFGGEVRTTAEFAANQSDYGLVLSGDRVLDGRRTNSGLARYANDKRPGDPGYPNVKTMIREKRDGNGATINLRPGRRIEAGEEIFVPYGDSYWGKNGDGVKRSRLKSKEQGPRGWGIKTPLKSAGRVKSAGGVRLKNGARPYRDDEPRPSTAVFFEGRYYPRSNIVYER